MLGNSQSGWRRYWRAAHAVRADLRVMRAHSEQRIAIAEDLRSRLEHTQRTLDALTTRVETFDARSAAQYDRQMQALRMVRDDDARAWERLWELRGTEDYELAYTESEPLVTIILPTYRNWELMRDRALPSVLAQTYEHWECLVVGDAAPGEAGRVVASFGEPRMRFINLPYRGPYPDSPDDAWLISGTNPFNTGLALSGGRWIGAVADDDALTPKYVELTLELARRERAEITYGKLRQHDPETGERILGGFPPIFGQWGVQGSLVHSALRFLPLQPSDWVFSVPNDWSWAERMLRIGVRFAMLDAVTAEYFPSQLWTDRPSTR